MNSNSPLRSVGILLFDDVELLDFAGPLQVFSALKYLHPELLPTVDTLGMSRTIRVSKSEINVQCNTTVYDTDAYDILVIPGGYGTRPILKDEKALSIIRRLIDSSTIITSVCTGSLLLAKLGLLVGKKATTHHKAFDILLNLDESIKVDREARYIDHGNIVIAQGVSAGIDMTFHLMSTHFGKEISDSVRKYIEYYPEAYQKG